LAVVSHVHHNNYNPGRIDLFVLLSFRTVYLKYYNKLLRQPVNELQRLDQNLLDSERYPRRCSVVCAILEHYTKCLDLHASNSCLMLDYVRVINFRHLLILIIFTY